LIVTVTLLVSACVGSKVVVEPGSSFNAGSYQSFAWSTEAITKDDRNIGYYNFDHFVRNGISAELIKKGYQEVPKEQADFFLIYNFFQSVTPDRGGLISPLNESNAAWDNGSDVNNTSLHNHYIPPEIQRGNLSLTIKDAKQGKEIWQATLIKIIEDQMDNKSSVKKAVKSLIPKLMKDFPAK
jgi:hypothetical protein